MDLVERRQSGRAVYIIIEISGKQVVLEEKLKRNGTPNPIGELKARVNSGEINNIPEKELKGMVQIPIGNEIWIVEPYNPRNKFENINPFKY